MSMFLPTPSYESSVVGGHGVGSDGLIRIFFYDFALADDVFDCGVVLALQPQSFECGACPLFEAGRFELRKIVVLGGKYAGVDLFVERFHVAAETITAPILKSFYAVGANAADIDFSCVDFVVYLPADDVFVTAELLCHPLGDSVGVEFIMLVVETTIAAGAYSVGGAVVMLGVDIGVFFGKPAGRASSRRSENNVNTALVTFIGHFAEQRKIELSVFRLHDFPGKFGNADGFYSVTHHVVEIFYHLRSVPRFWVVRNSHERLQFFHKFLR